MILPLLPGLPLLARGSEEDARALHARAQEEITAGNREAASRLLHDAVKTLGAEEPTPARDALGMAWEKAGEEIDARFKAHRDMERRMARRFVDLGETYIEEGWPSTAELFLTRAHFFDPRSAYAARARRNAAIETRDPTSARAKLDDQRLVALTAASTVAFSSGARALRNIDEFDRQNLEAFLLAARELAHMCQAYREANWMETAFELICAAQSFDRAKAAETYVAIEEELEEHRAEQRYQAIARPHMEDFRQRHRALGESRAWGMEARAIVAPPPHRARALVVSRRELAKGYRIEVDVKLGGNRGKAYVVFAFRDEDRFLAVEFDRTDSPWVMRIHDFEDGRSTVLAKTSGQWEVTDWHALTVEVRDGRVSATYAETSCAVKLPIPSAGAYGFLRPPIEEPPRKPHSPRHEVRFRNLVVTELDA